MSFYSAGYQGTRLCRHGDSQLSRIPNVPDSISMFASGWKFNVFYTQRNEWYGFGDNEYGQLGPIGDFSSNFCRISVLDSVVPLYFACGDKFLAIVSKEGLLICLGRGFGKQPRTLVPEKKITTCACGTESMMALCDGGGVYYWNDIHNPPVLVCEDVEFVDCACGTSQFLALTHTGVVYSWGKKKACGRGRKFQSFTPGPVTIDTTNPIVRVFAYNMSSVLLDNEGNLYSAGVNKAGQIGLGSSTKKANTFRLIESFSESKVFHVAIGDAASYFLTSDGKVYACGDGDDRRLMQNDREKKTVPTLCVLLNDMSVSYVTAGCSHVIVAVGVENIIPHPADASRNAYKGNIPKRLEFYNKKNRQLINKGLYSLFYFGFYPGDIVTNKNKDYRVIGVTGKNELIIEDESNEATFVSTQLPYTILESLKLKERPNSNLVEFKTRQQISLMLDTSPIACLGFGMEAGQKVSIPVFGPGTFVGVYGGLPYFHFEDDPENLVSCIRMSSIEELHDFLGMHQTDNTLLSDFGFKIGDIVSFDNKFYTVNGTFCNKAVCTSLVDHEISKIMITGMTLVRRESTDPIYVTARATDGTFVDIDVSYSKNDKFIPLDRVLTPKGLATVVGKDKGKLWIRPDDSFVLGGGVCITAGKGFTLLRRLGFEWECNGLNVGVTEPSEYYPGDFVAVGNNQALLFGRTDEGFMGVMLSKPSERIFIPCKDIDALVLRADLPGSVKLPAYNHLFYTFSVQLNDFYGVRMKPGDCVETPNGRAVVIGMIIGNIYFRLDSTGEVVCFTPQGVYCPNSFRIISRIGCGL